MVVGGCKGSCNFVPPVSSTEIYDPDTNKWTKAADLPIPIFGGSLQLLNNVPTLIGGTSRYTGGYDQTDVLYQYHVDKNEWIPLDFKLKKPVAFSAVIPVPKNYLQTC